MKTYNRGFTITPSDTVDLSAQEQEQVEAIFVGGAGNIVVVFPDDSTITLAGCLAGTIYPIRGFQRINSTSTSATNLRGLFQV